jgi:small subunit ribosomal protein S10
MQRIRIKIKGYDYKVVDKAVAIIMQNAVSTGAKTVGPIPLPTRRYKVAVHRSPHIDAKSKEHFILKTHKRLIDILEPNAKTIDALTHLQLPAGVGIEIKS